MKKKSLILALTALLVFSNFTCLTYALDKNSGMAVNTKFLENSNTIEVEEKQGELNALKITHEEKIEKFLSKLEGFKVESSYLDFESEILYDEQKVQRLRFRSYYMGNESLNVTFDHQYGAKGRAMLPLEDIDKVLNAIGRYGEGLKAEEVSKVFSSLWEKVAPLKGNPNKEINYDFGEVYYYVSEFGGLPLSGFVIKRKDPVEPEVLFKSITDELEIKSSSATSDLTKDKIRLSVTTKGPIKYIYSYNSIRYTVLGNNVEDEELNSFLKALDLNEKEAVKIIKAYREVEKSKKKPAIIESSMGKIRIEYVKKSEYNDEYMEISMEIDS